MKKIQEMKISELARFLPAKRTEGDCIGEPCMKATESEWGAIPYRVLKLWAKMIVKQLIKEHHEFKDCKKDEDDIHWKDGKPFGCSIEDDGIICSRCPTIKLLMERFEIKEEEIK